MQSAPERFLMEHHVCCSTLAYRIETDPAVLAPIYATKPHQPNLSVPLVPLFEISEFYPKSSSPKAGISNKVLSQMHLQLDSLIKTQQVMQAKVGLVPMCRSLTDGLITVPSLIPSLLPRKRLWPRFLLFQDPLSSLMARILDTRVRHHNQRLPTLVSCQPQTHWTCTSKA
jgi:hypothetical protein